MNRAIASLMQVAERAFSRGEWVKAERELQRVLELDAGNPFAMHALAMAQLQQGEVAAATQTLKSLVAAAPENPSAWNTLANLYVQSSQLPLAIETYERSLQLDGKNVNTLFNLALAYQSVGRSAPAVDLLKRVTELKPQDGEAWYQLGVSLTHEQRIDDALIAYQRSIELDPSNADALNGAGMAHMDAGRIDEARQWFERALAVEPGLPSAVSNLARTRRYTEDDLDEIARVESMLAQTPEEERVYLHFALGKMYDDVRRYERAYSHYEAGNEMKAKTHVFNAALHTQFIDDLLATFSEPIGVEYSGSDSQLPVFVVGMPRSGSSLIEQIISSHPQTYGVGEFGLLPELVQGIPEQFQTSEPFPKGINELGSPDLDWLVSSYLSGLQERAGNACRITDKMLSNYLHVGLIELLFPKAKILHCVRNPQDVCLSNYFQLFGFGQHFSYTWDALTHYYQEYLRVMSHWRSRHIPMLEVRYEALLEDPSSQVRRIIDYCGLEWDEACLAFQRSRHVVHTASNWQVRQPIYKTSRGRWEHYVDALPLSVKALSND